MNKNSQKIACTYRYRYVYETAKYILENINQD